MDTKNEYTEAQPQEIQIDIPDVTPDMKVSALTVDQLVKLLVQVSDQLALRRTMVNTDFMAPVIENIRQRIAEGGRQDTSSIENMVRQLQQEILNKFPEFMRRTL